MRSVPPPFFFLGLTPSLLGQLRDVKKKLGVEQFGATVNIWQTLQKSGVFLNELRAEDPSYHLLPLTEFTDIHAPHSYDINDISRFADSARELIRPEPMNTDFFEALSGRHLEDAFVQREHPVVPG